MKQQKSNVTPEKIEMLKQAMGVDSVSLRDRFAIAALQSNINQIANCGVDLNVLAKNCYEVADALLEERNKPNTGE